MIALIQAGGAGTRLKSITGDLPKPMVKIADKPILEWQIENLKTFGIDEIVIVVSKTGASIKEYFGDGSRLGVKIDYITESEPLGTGGAIFYAAMMFDEDFILLFGDLMLDIDWKRFIAFHKAKKALITAFAHPNDHPFDSDLLVTDGNERITKLDSKHNVRDYYYENLTNAGIYIVDKQVLSYLKEPAKVDFEKEILASAISEGGAYAYRSSEYVKDCGTPERYYAVSADCRDGIIARKNLSKPQKCVFLDRDGTLNVFGDFVRRSEGLTIMPDAAEAVKKLNESEYLAICVTNQPVVARGETTFEQLHQIHEKLEDLLGEGGAYLNDLYFCPHHPDGGYPGEVKELKIVCDCRKPKIGMLKRAQSRYNIDLTSSWMVGDSLQDVQTGINAGCRTILLTCGDQRKNEKYKNAKPDLVAASLNEAVDAILKAK
jgi:mannose-1-phosphate guanylyltransferase / phosphomannomutase